MTDYVTQQLRTVLKTYQDSAPKSLQGPGLSLVTHKKELESLERNDNSPNQTCLPPPVLPQPILTAPDPGRGVLYETILEGKPIGCFLLGGEMRLCLPQILNNILTDFTLEQINRSFDDLMIFCSQCTPDQLQEFKAAKILPDDVKGSGLITRTNAERLCSALIHRTDRYRSLKGAISFRVYHRCFGKCEGICTPDLFSLKDPSCVECRECHGMFSPQKFVCHVHNSHENRTCHWGFDSGNWRAYIQVALDEDNREKYSKMLDDIREQEIQESIHILNLQREREMCHPKRKAIEESMVLKTETLDIPLKKPKLTDAFLQEYQLQYMHNPMNRQQLSAFRPWITKHQLQQLQNILPPFNNNGIINGVASSPNGILRLNNEPPPILQNPERVVRLSESERFERTYQPNVALAPRKNILCKEKEREREREREKEKEREKEREREREREKERAEKERSVIKCDVQIKQEKSTTPPQIPMCAAPSVEYTRSVIKCDVQIKQERSTTPLLHNEILNSPELMPPSPKSPMPPTIKSNPIPFSTHKEIQSGSNEITSSTSPVPNNGNDAFLATPINGLTSSKLLVKETLSPPLPRRTPVPLENIHHKPHQQVIIVKNGMTNNVGHQNSGTAIFGNPEFELSTDTDDDSTEGCGIGEPDSSNLLAPWDLVVDVLKDIQPEGRDQILNLLKVLVQDNSYLKQVKMENARLLKQKDEQIAEVKRQKDNLQQTVNQLQQQLNRSLIKIATSEANVLQMQQHHQQQLEKMAAVHSSSTFLSSPSPSTTTPSTNNININNNNNNSQIIIEKVERRNSFADKGDVIMKPLKKCLRRSPEDTVLIMQSPPPPPPPDFQNLPASSLPILVKREIIINDELPNCIVSSPSQNKTSSPSSQVVVDIKVKDNSIKSANN